MTAFPLKPNWTRGWTETWSYLTEVIESENGKEQRRARRLKPRHSFNFETLDLRGRALARQHAMTRLADVRVFADAVRSTDAAGASAGAVTLTVASRPWLSQARFLVAETAGGERVALAIASVAGSVATLVDPLPFPIMLGTRVFLGLPGRLTPTQSAQRMSTTLSGGDLQVDVEPGGEVVVPGAAPLMFNGREVFAQRPNWSEPLVVDYEDSQTYVDVETGPVSPYRRRSWTRETYRRNHQIRTADQLNATVGVFHRARGRQGEVYLPTWTDDFPLMDPVSLGSKFWRTAGHAFAQAYADSPVHRAIAVRTRGGALHLLRVADITQGGTSAPWSMIETVEGAPVALTPGDVETISWMPVARFASDDLTISWQTDQFATANFNLVTLEDL